MIHGTSGLPAIVTRSVARGRSRLGPVRDIPDLKRRAHRKHRRAWRRWCADPERAEPQIRSLTSWEVW